MHVLFVIKKIFHEEERVSYNGDDLRWKMMATHQHFLYMEKPHRRIGYTSSHGR
jgi:hypothetical protein